MIEVAIRSCITNAVSEYFNDLFWITNPAYFFSICRASMYTQDTIDDCRKHYVINPTYPEALFEF